MKFVYSDGGRSKYYKASDVSDCVVRAICNATGKDYKEVYDIIQYLEKTLKIGKHERKGSARNGVRGKVYKYYIEKELGWIHHSTVRYQQGISMHLTEEEIPMGNLIVDISHHLTNVKNKVIYDTYDCSENTYYDRDFGCYVTNSCRAIYNYWTEPTEDEKRQKQELLHESERLKQIQENHLKETKHKIDCIKCKYAPKLSNLEKQIKKLQHELKIQTNRMNKEIKKLKESDSKVLLDKLLEA